MRQLLAAALLVLLALGVPRAWAQEVAETDVVDIANQYALSPGKDLTATESESKALRSYRGAGGLHLVISRLEYPNLPAWWKDDRKSFFAQVERGLARVSPGYQLKKSKSQRIDRVPVLDLEFQRETEVGKERVWMRFLLHRRFAIVATAALPSKSRRALRKRAQTVVRSLRPAKSPDPT